MDFFFLIVVLFALASAKFLIDFTASSSSLNSSGNPKFLGPLIHEEDEQSSYEDSHPPVEQPVPLRNSSASWSSFYD